MKITGQGIFETVMEERALITVRSQREFTVIVNDEIVAPNNALDRYAQFEVEKEDKIHISMDDTCIHTIIIKTLPNKKEIVSSESTVETIPEGELSIYDRLRGEMLGIMSQYAEAKGMDSYEEDNDFEMEDEDEPLINTPYEYKAMIDEYPIEEKEPEPETEPETEPKPETEPEPETTENKN